MLDPAILLHLTQPPLPPEPSRVAQEQVWLSEQGQQAQKIAARLAEQYGTSVDGWIAQLSALRQAYALIPPSIEAPEVLDLLTDAVEQTEAMAELRARGRAQLAKRARRDAKAQFRVDASMAAVTRELGARLLATDDRVIEALLDQALFLRAARSERSPRDEAAPVFDDPVALEAYLHDALA